MEIKKFWSKRRQNYLKKLLYYLRYIFNDHFILFLFILLGGLIYLYSEFIKSLDPSSQWPLILAAIVLSLLVFIGQFTTLLTSADKIFLTPLEEKLDPIIQKLRYQSLILPALLLFFVSLLAIPLFAVYDILSFSQFYLLTILLILMKVGELFSQQAMMKEWGRGWKIQHYLINGFIYLAIWLVFIYFSKILAFIMVVSYLIGEKILYKRFFQSSRWNWEYMIHVESQRMKNLLNKINLFTDVAEVSSLAKRRAYLDPFINCFPKSKTNPALYLMLRSFFRRSEYLNLSLRLVIVASLLTILIPYLWLRFIIALLFIYLLGFQLIPLAFEYSQSNLQAVYPLPKDLKLKSMQTFLFYILLVVSLIVGLFGFWATSHWAWSFMNLILYILFSYIFSHYYVKWRLIKKFK